MIRSGPLPAKRSIFHGVENMRSTQFFLPTALALLLAGMTEGADAPAPVDAKKVHWAWKAPVIPVLPAVRDPNWARNAIDRFILAKLESAGLAPAPAASPQQLIRRATFDLTGLPPTPEEVDAFVNDPSPNAWDKVIDRLLASPHYGERWGRHWLDLVRFAESNGYEFDEVRPNAWRYRDFVVQSFNDDKPYDRFIKEQLAGDELSPDDPQARIATGFNLLGPDMTDSSDKKQRRQNTLNDMTDTVGLAFLGMTITCARCHDHKFEPIPQTDYYRLQAFFTPAQFRLDVPVPPREQKAALEAAALELEKLTKPQRDALAEIEEPIRRKLFETKLARLPEETQKAHRTPEDERTGGQKELVETTLRLVRVASTEIIGKLNASDQQRYRELQLEIKKLEAKKPVMPIAMGIQDAAGPAPKTYLLGRGELSNPGDEVAPGFPVALLPGQKPLAAPIEPRKGSTGRRLALAEWLSDRSNPLTARVLVNRLWQHHFGRGIVPTASDFGVHGLPPTHPELLDWLACDFMDGGWQIKRLHKLILTSAAYRQGAAPTAAALKLDPDNRLFSRVNRLRLEGEIIRDSLLAVSGRLNPQMGGPGVFPPIPPDAIKGAKGWVVSSNPDDHRRRSMYIFARRNLRFPFLETFDLPDSNLSCPKREQSTTAPQALALLNAADVIEAADALAGRVSATAKTDDERIALAYRLALGRAPAETELTIARKFLDHSPMRELCRALFNLNEFVYLD
jgi:hypothetical protein